MDFDNNQPAPPDAGHLASGDPARRFSSPRGAKGGDVISRPSHYMGLGGLEARHVIRDWRLGFELGNVVKYILRHRAKSAPLQDLLKARQYTIFALEQLDEDGLIEWVVPGSMLLTPGKIAAAFDLGPTLTEALAAVHLAVTIPDIASRQLECVARCLGQAIVALQAQVQPQ